MAVFHALVANPSTGVELEGTFPAGLMNEPLAVWMSGNANDESLGLSGEALVAVSSPLSTAAFSAPWRDSQ
jgi:hypothetical protein